MTIVLQTAQHYGTTVFVDLCLTFSAPNEATNGSPGKGGPQFFLLSRTGDGTHACAQQHALTGALIGVGLSNHATLFLIGGEVYARRSGQFNLTVQRVGTSSEGEQSGKSEDVVMELQFHTVSLSF
jgi:hypothetical protein